jgi:hypothetical protein
LELRLQFKNVSGAAFRLYAVNHRDGWEYWIEDLASRERWRTAPRVFERRTAPTSILLAPGQAHEATNKLDWGLNRVPPEKGAHRPDPQATVHHLPPGQYQVWLPLVLHDPHSQHWGPEPYWAGTLTSQPAGFVIGK